MISSQVSHQKMIGNWHDHLSHNTKINVFLT